MCIICILGVYVVCGVLSFCYGFYLLIIIILGIGIIVFFLVKVLLYDNYDIFMGLLVFLMERRYKMGLFLLLVLLVVFVLLYIIVVYKVRC